MLKTMLIRRPRKRWPLFFALAISLIPNSPTRAQLPVTHADFMPTTSEIPITDWQFVGPFFFDKKEIEKLGADELPVGLGRDFLKDLGVNEATVTATELLGLKASEPGARPDSRFLNKPISATPKTNILQLASDRKPLNYAVAYLAVTIESPRDREVVIAAGVDDSMKVWLNHELLFSDVNTAAHFMKKYQRLIGAKLKKGDNLLLLKTANLSRDWRLIVNLDPKERALELAKYNAINPILVRSVAPTNGPLKMRGDLLPSASRVRMEITDARHVVVDSAELNPAREIPRTLEQLKKDQVYYCRLSFGGQKLERPFFYGDLEAGFSRLSKLADRFGNDEAISIDLQAQLGRLRHLLLKDSRVSESWDQKVAASFAELEENLSALNDGPDAFKSSPGTHLRGYRSSVDAQVQNYWIHVPPQTNGSSRSLPLVVVLPWTAAQNLPFLESYQMAAFDENERYRILGDEYGFGVLQVWGRGNYMGGTAIWTADVMEALAAVKKDYSIDENRIYLLGYCEGGRQALLLGERYPDLFAAIAVEGPITILRTGASYHALWDQYSSPVSQVQNLVNTPVLISHEETDDPPVQDSETFAAKGRQAGVDVTLIRTQGGEHGFSQDPTAVRRSLFEFFRGKQRRMTSQKPLTDGMFESFRSGRGPIEHIFGAPFLLVAGTGGSPTQNMVIQNLVDEFRDEWRKEFFVECLWKKDTEVNSTDLEKFNLILVGDRESNSLIARMSQELPLRVSGRSVEVEGRISEGDLLGYIFIATNPLKPSKEAVVIGMNNWSPANRWKFYLPRFGICDYFIFDLQGATPRLRDAGYFSPDGQRYKDSTPAVPAVQ